MIGVVGGYGDVGTPACRRLVAAGLPVRVGGRDPVAAEALAATLGADYRRVDFRDESTVDHFASGCRVVLNCAGPAHAVGDRIARAAARAGADYVDVAGDDPLYRRLDAAPGQRVVLSAGLRPGLTGLFPRVLAESGVDVRTLTVSFGLRDRFTPTAAADYLQATGIRPLAAWRGGPREGALTRTTATDLPFFPGEVTVTPLLSTEDERLARALGLVRGEWYSVAGGDHVRAAFDRVHAVGSSEAVDLLCRASRLDLAGRKPLVTVVAQVEGHCGRVPVRDTSVLTGPGNAEVTGAVAACAVLAVVQGRIPAGVHYAAEILEPGWALEWLVSVGAVRVRRVGPVTEMVEEGAL
ncbi:saccharopine dehydrogenase NADP-binding domain-containing protein [Amycolatopsis jejuensis]|uniref:saccharopine dehydrogenase NADP-binding domain-containing protein n=1 Tax=Amycolatopsis jejuensis TaxID=330084 RepID=UPI0005243169|nr:saccharopine dehydrogenase NADP-binding domain-containing protein [Amycolatopsis jejuensis]